MSERAKGWIWPTAVALFAFALRVWHLGRPRSLSFDERYYAENAWSMLHVGYAQDFAEGAERKIAAGHLHGLFVTGQPTQVVHPDAAKWLIAAGEALFGFDSFGWRIASAVVGALTVLVLARLVLRLTGSLPFACFAGFLLALDGLHITLSRLALLDVFVTFWIVCAVACLVADRDWIARRLDRHRFWRPWQLLAGVCFGLACGSKWNGVYALAAFGVTVVAWEFALRRSQTAIHPILSTLAIGVPAFVRVVVVAAVVYVFTWAGWLANHGVYEHRFGHGYGDEPAWGSYVNQPTTGPWSSTTHALRSMWKYQEMTYRFHTGSYLAKQTHPYQSHAIGWLVQARPVSAAVHMDVPANRCGAAADSSCMRETLLLGNPAVWWTGVVAMVVSALAWARGRRWQDSIPIVGLIATWVPWLPIMHRPIFAFYAVTTLPFLILALALTLHATGQRARTPRQTYAAALGVGVVMTSTVACAVYFWPVWTYGLIPYEAWHARMWFGSWI